MQIFRITRRYNRINSPSAFPNCHSLRGRATSPFPIKHIINNTPYVLPIAIMNPTTSEAEPAFVATLYITYIIAAMPLTT